MPRARPRLARGLRGRAWRAAPPTLGRLGHGGRLPDWLWRRLFQVNGLLGLILGGGGQASFGGTWTREPGAVPSASSTRSCVRRRLPKVSGPVPGGPGSSQVCPVGPALRVTPGRDLGACDPILPRQTSARGPQTLSLLSRGSRGPCPSAFRELGGSRPWSSPA